MGDKLENYVIEKRLASALFGDVLLCTYKPTNEKVAVKRILRSAAKAQRTLISDKKVREDVDLELTIYRTLKNVGGHANILSLREEIEFDGYLYIVFDFCDRGELYEVVSNAENSKLSIAQSVKYTQQIAQGVEFLHNNGYAHRDLSLENVLLTSDDNCHVCDFGLATVANKRCSETVGKMFYMAPEVLAEDVSYDPKKADVWSLGVMLFIMLTGAPPVERADMSDKRFALIASNGVSDLIKRWDMTKDISSLGMDLLEKMMHVDPTQRISISKVLEHPFISGKSYISSSSVTASTVEVEKEKGFNNTPETKESSSATTSKDSSFTKKAWQRLTRRGSKRIMAASLAPCA